MEHTEGKTKIGLGGRCPWPILLTWDDDCVYLELLRMPAELEGKDVYLCLEQATCRSVYSSGKGRGNPCHTGGKFLLYQSGDREWQRDEERIIANPEVGMVYAVSRVLVRGNEGSGHFRYCPSEKPNPWTLIRGTLRVLNVNGTLMRTIHHSNTAKISI